MKFLISWVLRTVPRKYLQRVAHWGARLLGVFYVGNRVVCNICGRHYRKFLPYGRKGRSNALCPGCLSLERHRLIWLFLQQRTDFFQKRHKTLHIAPEYCFLPRFRKLLGPNYVTADLESPLAQVKLDVMNMPLPDNSFEVVFCNHVLEHVADDRQAMREIYRVLKPGGWGILQIPLFHPLPATTYEDPTITDAAGRERAFGQDDHVRLYGKDYTQRLQEAGFQAQEVWLTRELGAAEVARYALPQNEPVFFVRKPAAG